MLASLQSGGTRSVVSSIPPVDQQKIDAVFPEYRLEYFEPERQAFNDVLRRAAEDFGAVFNDMEPVYAAFSPAELTIEDGVHLNGTRTVCWPRGYGRCFNPSEPNRRPG